MLSSTLRLQSLTCGEELRSAALAQLEKASHDQPMPWCGRNSETTVPLPSWSCSCGRRSLCQDRRLQVLGYGSGTAKFETVSLRSSQGFSTLQSSSDFFKFLTEPTCEMCSGIRSRRLYVQDPTPEPQWPHWHWYALIARIPAVSSHLHPKLYIVCFWAL